MKSLTSKSQKRSFFVSNDQRWQSFTLVILIGPSWDVNLSRDPFLVECTAAFSASSLTSFIRFPPSCHFLEPSMSTSQFLFIILEPSKSRSSPSRAWSTSVVGTTQCSRDSTKMDFPTASSDISTLLATSSFLAASIGDQDTWKDFLESKIHCCENKCLCPVRKWNRKKFQALLAVTRENTNKVCKWKVPLRQKEAFRGESDIDKKHPANVSSMPCFLGVPRETARNDRTQWKCHWSVALVEFSIELFSKCNWVKGRWAQIHGILFLLFLSRLMGMKCFSHSMNLNQIKTYKQYVDKDLDWIWSAWVAYWVRVGEEEGSMIRI